LPGYELFQYVDEVGERRSIGSSDVNEYLREATGEDFTAKDFRTWAGTALAVEALCSCESFATHRQAKKNINAVVEKVADRLGNTVAVCKKCYIHPAVFETYVAGSLTRPPSAREFARLLKKWSTPKPKQTLEKSLVNSVKAARKK
jgi:DNA topoisomerase-1